MTAVEYVALARKAAPKIMAFHEEGDLGKTVYVEVLDDGAD